MGHFLRLTASHWRPVAIGGMLKPVPRNGMHWLKPRTTQVLGENAMLIRISVWTAILAIPLVAASAELTSADAWKKLSTLDKARQVRDVKVKNGCELQIEGVRCRLLGIRLRPDESSQRDAARFLARYVESAGRVLQIGNVHQPAEDKDHTPLIWLDRGYYGLPAQQALVAAGLATLDDTGIEKLVLYNDGETRRFELDWKGLLRNAEAGFKIGKDLEVGFDWPSPVPPDDLVVSRIQSRLGKPDNVINISGRSYLRYRLSGGRTLALVVYRGAVTEATLDGGNRQDSQLQSLIQARLGGPQGIFKSSERVFLDYNMGGDRTLSIIVSDGNLLGMAYTKTADLRNLAGLKLTVQGVVDDAGKPGLLLDTHRGPIYISGGPREKENAVASFAGKRVTVTGVLKYQPPYPMPLPWPPVQLPPNNCFYFDTANVRVVASQ
jgi:hypothetical protein